MNKDLTSGNVTTVLWRFCLPLFGSILFQQLYNIADSFVAGKFIGENALAAVGNSYEITLIFIAFAFGCNIASSIVVARLFGAKRYGELKTAVYTTFIATIVCCLALMLFGFLFIDNMLVLIHTPAEIFADSLLYLDIYIKGLLFLFLYNVATGIFSALGDSKTPFYFLSISSLSNIFMDILFVTKFNMGVSGVAWATFLCQGASCILSLIYLFLRLRKLPNEEPSSYFNFELLKSMTVIAVPSILQQSFISVGNILIQSLINGYGPAVIAGYSAAIKLNNLVITSFTTLGNGMSNFTAQNMGAKQPKRVHEGFFSGLKMIYLLTIPMVLLYWFAASWLIKLFMNQPSDAALTCGVQILRIISPFYFIVACKMICDGILRGLGKMNEFMIATFSDLLLRVLLAYFLSTTCQLGSIGIWCAWPIGWTVATGISYFYYRKEKTASKIN